MKERPRETLYLLHPLTLGEQSTPEDEAYDMQRLIRISSPSPSPAPQDILTRNSSSSLES
jgi:hypothetical protein